MDKYIKNSYENVLVYARSVDEVVINTNKVVANLSGYNLSDEISQYKKGYPLHNGTAAFHINNRPNLAYSIYYNPETTEAVTIDEKVRNSEGWTIGITNEGHELVNKGYVRIIPKQNTKYGTQRVWRWGSEKFNREYKTELIFTEEETGAYFYQKDRIDADGTKEQLFTNYIDIDTSNGKSELNDVFNNKVYFDFPKTIKLVIHLLNIGSKEDSIILDFFSGSATTAHAVMQLNAEDGGNRKWIMVQLPEETDEKSEAFKAGYKTIPEISRERIRRAGDKIAGEHPDAKVDYGFRALRIDDTNMKDVYRPATDVQQSMLDDLVDNVREDRSDLDLLFGVLTHSALELNRPLETAQLDGRVVYKYDYFGEVSGLVACFAPEISEATIKSIAAMRPLTAVFREASFHDSQAKVNLAEHFRIISPDTKVKVV